MGRKVFITIVSVLMLTSMAFSQKYGTTPEDSAECVKNISLYGQFYKQKNIKDAITPWRQVFLNCPQASQNTFIRGATIVKYMYNLEKDAKNRKTIIDTLMMVYDKRIEFFGKEGYVRGRQGCDLYNLDKKQYQKSYEYLNKSVQLESNKTKSDVCIFYLTTAVKKLKDSSLTQLQLIEAFDVISNILEFNIKNNAKKQQKYMDAQLNCEALVEPYISCEDLINIYRPKFDENKADLDLLKRITGALSKKECVKDPLFFEATKELHKLEPTAQSAYLMGKMNVELNKYGEAVTYLKEAIELFENDLDKTKAYMLLGESYKNLGQLSAARNQFMKVTEIKPNDGKPYIFIGDMYYSSAKDCMDRELKVSYWAAADKYYKAKQVDTTAAIIDVANQKINSAYGQFPDNESIFFHDLEVGKSYSVGCWIQESTTIRARK